MTRVEGIGDSHGGDRSRFQALVAEVPVAAEGLIVSSMEAAPAREGIKSRGCGLSRGRSSPLCSSSSSGWHIQAVQQLP